MLVVPIMVLCGTLLSFKSSILVMFYHGVRSSLLFMMVGVMYSMLGTRQLLLIRGLISLSPLISFLIVISFLYTVSAPPFPSFYAEFLTVLSSFQLSYLYVIFFIIYLFIVMLYNLNWLVSVSFSYSSISSPMVFNTQASMPVFLFLIFTLFSMFICYFF